MAGNACWPRSALLTNTLTVYNCYRRRNDLRFGLGYCDGLQYHHAPAPI